MQNLFLECNNRIQCNLDLVTFCDLVTIFAETKTVTKSRLHCTYAKKKSIIWLVMTVISASRWARFGSMVSHKPIEYWEIRATNSTSWRHNWKFETSFRPLRLNVWSQEVAEVAKVQTKKIQQAFFDEFLEEFWHHILIYSQYSSKILNRIAIEFSNSSQKCYQLCQNECSSCRKKNNQMKFGNWMEIMDSFKSR